MKIQKITLISFLCLLLGACVRFTDARAKLIREQKFDPSADRVGIDAFYRYDREQRTRLSELIESRMQNAAQAKSLEYQIGAGDEITLYVMNFEEVSRDYKVAPDGSINLPFVGKISVKDKTEEQAAALVSKKLAGFVVDPVVTIEVSDYSAYKVWIVRSNAGRTDLGGQTEHKNAFPLKRPLYPLVELLLEAGQLDVTSGQVIYLYPQSTGIDANSAERLEGIGANSNPYCGKVTISEAGSKNNQDKVTNCNSVSDSLENKYSRQARIQIDLEELFGGATQTPVFVPLLPGDIVVIPERSSVQVYGEVFERGGFEIGGNFGQRAGIKPSLLSVISAARGFTYSADINQVEIFREIEFGKKVVLSVDFEELVLKKTQDVRLRDGDVVWVPSHDSRFYEEHSIRAINALLGTARGVETSID
jgi:protein involved in polysaccharide export with SLBB domain